MDGALPSNPSLAHADSPAVDDSGSDLYPDSPAQMAGENNRPQPSVPQENPAALPSPLATQVLLSETVAAGLMEAASPESDISSFDDVYNEASIPTDGTAAAGLQGQTPLPETKPNGMNVSSAMGNTVEAQPPAAGSAVSAEQQAIDGAGDAMPAASAPHAHHGVPEHDIVDPPLDGASSHDSSLSTDSSGTSSSEDEDSDGDVPLLDAAEQAKLLMAEAIEMADVAPPAPQFTKPNVTVTPDMAITPVGTIEKVVELQAMVRANTSGSYRVLDTGSVLCLQDRSVIGSVFDIVGRVHEPAYTVGFTSEQDLKDSGIAVGTPVYYVDAHSTYVFTQPLQLAKGTDASNADDEGSDAELAFSDDEMEAAHKRKLKQSRPHDAPAGDGSAGAPPTGPARTRGGRRNKRQRLDVPRGNDPSRGNDPPRSSGPARDGHAVGTNFGGDGDAAFAEGYQPLRRPDNLVDLMQRGPQPGIERGPLPNVSRRQRARRERRDRDRRERREVNRRGPSGPGRFDRDSQGPRGYGHGNNGDLEQRDSRGSRDGYRRGQQEMQDQRSGYGINSATAQTHQPFPPSSPASAPSAAQTDPAAELGRYRQGQYSSYSASSSSTQARPYVPPGQYSQYSTSQTPGYGQQAYSDHRSAHGSDQQYNPWQRNRGASAPTNEYKPSFSLAAASSLSAPAPSVAAPQQIAPALQFGSGLLNPQALTIFSALQQAQAAFNPVQPPQAQPPRAQPPQHPPQGGNPGAANPQDVTSILERLKAAGQQFRDGYR
jgi:H/ACA ribonucleoprotein complex non-core subunit NAF1